MRKCEVQKRLKSVYEDMVYFIKGIADSRVYKCPQRDKNTINQAHYRRRYPHPQQFPDKSSKKQNKKELDWISPSSKIQGILKDGFHAESVADWNLGLGQTFLVLN